ncbi:adenylate kinase [soil metagenome]
MADADKYRTILLFGMPGSGKGTQGAVLGQLPSLIHISSGDLFRRLPKHGELGREVVHNTTQGLLVPDELTVRIWHRHIRVLELQDEVATGQTTLILDGLPRTYAQAESMAQFIKVIQIFHLRIDNVERAKDRLRTRALRENRLDDISEDVVRRRMQLYNEETVQTLRFYDPSLVYKINACQTPLKVHLDIVKRLCEIEADFAIEQGSTMVTGTA